MVRPTGSSRDTGDFVFMPPKMNDRMDAVETRIEEREGSVRHKLREFQAVMMGDIRDMMMIEFAKMRERPSSEQGDPPLFSEESVTVQNSSEKVELLSFDSEDPVG